MTGTDVVAICRDLLRIDSSNPGSTEEKAAEYVTGFLGSLGVPHEVVEPAPGRCSVISRASGADRRLPALLVHSHLDVVPPQSEGWSHDPFGGVEADGCLWGRGALDMKAFAAMMLAAQTEIAAGMQLQRDVVFAYFADEEMGGTLGSQWLATHRPDLFDGVTEAVGEMGAFAVHAGAATIYPVQVAERGMVWIRISIPGIAGHAAYPIRSNPLDRLPTLLGRIASLHIDEAPLEASVRFRADVAAALSMDGAAVPQALGDLGSFVERGERTTFVPTVVAGGAKTNVVPDVASVTIDCRFLPGSGDRALEAVVGILDDDMTLEVLQRCDGIASPVDSALFRNCRDAIASHDPTAVVVPFVMPAGTDAQRLTTLGIAGYGFTPLALPSGFDYLGLFHAPDERVPVDAIRGGWTIFRTFLVRM
jgi:acetylornithine deacetylase/succinyl-diaminopimelate desuccinylase-like protein